MKLALFYELPVPRPWTRDSEHTAFQNTLEQTGSPTPGLHSFWTVEHHFLDEFSHCSAPGVLYGAIAAKTEIRIGHGVRLLPFPYNHPVRAAEAAAIARRAVRRPAGVRHRPLGHARRDGGLRHRPARHPPDVGGGARAHRRRWTHDEFSWDGEYFMPPPRASSRSRCRSRTRRCGARRRARRATRSSGARGIGLLSFSVAVPPEALAKRFGRYRDGLADVKPVGQFINDRIGTFAQVHCAETTAQAHEDARTAFPWYIQQSLRAVASLGDWRDGTNLGSYEYAKQLLNGLAIEDLTFDYLIGNETVMCGDPDHCVEMARRYEAVGVDLLMCLVQSYDIPHEKVMRSIELLGTEVLPRIAKPVAHGSTR